MRIEHLFESNVTELYNISNKQFRVYENPSAKQTLALETKSKDKCLRAVLDLFGNLYVWDAYYSNHMDVINDLGIDYQVTFAIYKNKIAFLNDISYKPLIMANHNVQRALGLISESILTEKPLEKNNVQRINGNTLIKNPTSKQLEKLKKLSKDGCIRAIIDSNGDLWMWDTHKLSIYSMMDYLQLRIRIMFCLVNNKIAYVNKINKELIKQNKNVIRALNL